MPSLSQLTSAAVIAFVYSILQRPHGRGFYGWMLYMVGLSVFVWVHPTAYDDTKTIDFLALVGGGRL